MNTAISPTKIDANFDSLRESSAAFKHRFKTCLEHSNGTTLDLSSLHLIALPPLDDLSLKFSFLRHLNIRRNALRSLPEGLAQAFPELITLDASDNALESLSDASIGAFRNLQRLNVARNQIREFPAAMFQNLEELEKLDARENLIENISFDFKIEKAVAAKVSKLQVLLLADNRLRTITLVSPESMPKLRVVDLSGNPELTTVAEEFRRLHEHNLLLRSRAKRRELITRALSIRKAVVQALATSKKPSK